MTALQSSWPAEGESTGQDPHLEHAVLTFSGLVMPAAGEPVAAEQAERIGGCPRVVVDGEP